MTNPTTPDQLAAAITADQTEFDADLDAMTQAMDAIFAHRGTTTGRAGLAQLAKTDANRGPISASTEEA